MKVAREEVVIANGNCCLANYIIHTTVLQNSKLLQCNLDDRKLVSCKLRDRKPLSCKLNITNFIPCILQDRELLSCKLHDKILPYCKLHDGKFLRCILQDRELLSCKLHYKILPYCKLHDAKFLRWGFRRHIYQCVKCILRTSPYSVRMQENVGKMRTRITPNTDTFYAVYVINLFYIFKNKIDKIKTFAKQLKML